MRFFNSIQKNMGFADVIASIKYFIKGDLDGNYRIAVGTDSRVKGRFTCFATGIHIHRIGYGAWCCVTKRVENKAYVNLKEKIAKEALMTYEIAAMLNEELSEVIGDFSAKHKSFGCKIEAHIDIGTKGETRKLVREMTGYFEGAGIDAKIKPEAFVASSYANRYSRDNKVS